MKALPLPGRGVPNPVYGVVVIIVVLVCLIILGRQGVDPTAATAAIVTLMVTGADVVIRLRRAPPPNESPAPAVDR